MIDQEMMLPDDFRTFGQLKEIPDFAVCYFLFEEFRSLNPAYERNPRAGKVTKENFRNHNARCRAPARSPEFRCGWLFNIILKRRPQTEIERTVKPSPLQPMISGALEKNHALRLPMNLCSRNRRMCGVGAQPVSLIPVHVRDFLRTTLSSPHRNFGLREAELSTVLRFREVFPLSRIPLRGGSKVRDFTPFLFQKEMGNLALAI